MTETKSTYVDTRNYAEHERRRPIPLPDKLPDGLVVHCDECKMVVPSDAPRSASADCGFVARHKLSWFSRTETIAAQHVMAVAAWSLIHDAALKAGEASVADYHRQFRADRKAHFAASAARQAMSPVQVAAALLHRRDGALYK